MRAQSFRHRYLDQLILAAMLLLAACQSTTPVPNFTPVHITPSVRPPLAMGPNPSIPAPSRTPSPVPYATTTPTTPPTETAAPTMTGTPLPTLPSREAQERVCDLFLNNAGCRLPCWWGITPGKTPWEEARQFLESFTEVKTDNSHTRLGDISSEQDYRIDYSISEDKSFGMGLTIRHDSISIISVGLNNTGNSRYELSQLLAEYGKPDDVFIQAFPDPNNGTLFILILLYSNQHFLVEYLIFDSRIGDLILGCPPFNDPILYLWSEDIEWTDQRIKDDVMGLDPYIHPQPIGDVTEMNVEEFFNTYRKTNTKVCIKTQKSAWP